MRWHVVTAVIVTAAVAIVVHVTGRAPARNLGDGPGPSCPLPPRVCAVRCDQLEEMPLAGVGYEDDRVEEESIPETSTSFIRRDLMMVVQYAAAKVACKAAAWNTGVGGPIALGDMSQRDGETPGMVWRMPRHPQHTHTNGLAIDIAYYQRDTPDNRQRAICQHFRSAKEQWRCVAPPHRLDAWRTALFIGAFLEEPRIRVIGIDGEAASPILAAFDELCARDWIEPAACSRRDRIRFETTNTGRGWFFGHHNHLHVAWNR